MTLKTIPWALTDGGAAANPAERVRQAHQAHLSGTGVVNATDLAVTALGTPNMSVNVAAGSVWIPGTLGSTTGEASNWGQQSSLYSGLTTSFTSQGAYFDFNDATVNLAVAAANATNPRIDLVCATVQDADYSGAANQALLQVVTGTPAASPVPPTVPANTVVLAQIAVGAGVTSITSGNITDERPVALPAAAPFRRLYNSTISGASGATTSQGIGTVVTIPALPYATTHLISVGSMMTAASGVTIDLQTYVNGAMLVGSPSPRLALGNASSTTFAVNVAAGLSYTYQPVAVIVSGSGSYTIPTASQYSWLNVTVI